MSDSAFSNEFAAIGSFRVMTAAGQFYGTCVKVTCELDDKEFARKAIDVFTALQFELTAQVPAVPSSRFDINGKIVYLKGTGRKEMCYWTWVRIEAGKVEAWLRERELDLPVATSRRHVLNAESLSIGPCSFVDADGKRFVKVRFDKISIPFYFVKGAKIWDEATTNAHVVKLAGPNLSSSIMEVVKANLSSIMRRAVERPLNHSFISEYGTHRLEYFEKLTVKVNGRDTQIFKRLHDEERSRLARPDFEPALVFEYSASHESRDNRSRYFAYIDEQFFSVVGFVNPYEESGIPSSEPTVVSFENRNPQKLQYKYAHYRLGPRNNNTRDGGSPPGWMGPLSVLLPIDIDPLDPRDEYVKERIARAIKHKM